MAQQFIALGEAFTHTHAAGLRGHVAKASATFFAAKQHRQLEVLRMMLDRELWQVCMCRAGVCGCMCVCMCRALLSPSGSVDRGRVLSPKGSS